MPGWEEMWGSCAPLGLVMKFALFQNSHFQRSTLEVCPNVSLRREVRLLLTTRIGSEVCILLWPISWSFMFVLMCDWEEKWGFCSPPGLVMKFALFCDHQRDAKCDTFWELSKVFPKSSGKWTWGPPLTKVIIHKLSAEQFLWNRNWDLGWFWAGWQ